MKSIDRRAALTALLAAAVAQGADAQTIGRAIDDGVITAKLKDKFSAEFGANMISIETKDGIVRLYGAAESALAAARAEQIARSVDGVKGVQNELRR